MDGLILCVPWNIIPDQLDFGLFHGLSKIFEFGDTVFIVLRKQKLIFLHWYHHVVVMICVFYAKALGQPFGRWFATINYAVHAIMYSYYTLRALKIRVPKIVAMMITAIQSAQVSFFGQE